MRQKKISILLVIFVVLALIASFLLYYSHQLPVREQIVASAYTYRQYGTFDYLAMLKPNTLYNKTTLGPDEGALFISIIDVINVDFTYNFQGDESASLTVRYYVDEYLESSSWQKKIGEVQQETATFTGADVSLDLQDIPPVNVSSVKRLAETIAQETGLTAFQYNVTTTVTMEIEASTPEGSISESFAPKLIMTFPSVYSTVDEITIEGIQNNRNGDIETTENIYRPEVETQRQVSYALSAIAFPGVLVTAWAYARSKPTEPVKPETLNARAFEEYIKPFKQVVSETIQEPSFKEQLTIVRMKTLTDLAKVSDALSKPIIHTHRLPETHILYVIDETTLYEYTITDSSINEGLEEEEEE